jgi:hypothetical protein
MFLRLAAQNFMHYCGSLDPVQQKGGKAEQEQGD